MMEDACGGVRHEGRMDGYDEVIKSNNIINFKYNHPDFDCYSWHCYKNLYY